MLQLYCAYSRVNEINKMKAQILAHEPIRLADYPDKTAIAAPAVAARGK